jgi:hypothetical protein
MTLESFPSPGWRSYRLFFTSFFIREFKSKVRPCPWTAPSGPHFSHPGVPWTRRGGGIWWSNCIFWNLPFITKISINQAFPLTTMWFDRIFFIYEMWFCYIVVVTLKVIPSEDWELALRD